MYTMLLKKPLKMKPTFSIEVKDERAKGSENESEFKI